MGAFVHRAVVEDRHTYAVRIDDGALLDGAEQIERARRQLTETGASSPPASSPVNPDMSTASSTRSPLARKLAR
jgi:hypothetical protein